MLLNLPVEGRLGREPRPNKSWPRLLLCSPPGRPRNGKHAVHGVHVSGNGLLRKRLGSLLPSLGLLGQIPRSALDVFRLTTEVFHHSVEELLLKNY
jgi:hypothetical protein